MATHSIFLTENSHRQRRLVGPKGHKQTRLTEQINKPNKADKPEEFHTIKQELRRQTAKGRWGSRPGCVVGGNITQPSCHWAKI